MRARNLGVGAVALAIMVMAPLLVSARAASAAKPSPGFVVSGAAGTVLTGHHQAGAVVVDRQGREHVFAVTWRSPHHRITYRYQVRGAGGRLKSSERRTLAVVSPAEVTAFLSTNGRKLVVVLAGCKDIWTSQTPVTAHRLHPLKRAIGGSVKHCAGDFSPVRFGSAVPLPGGRIAMMAAAGRQDYDSLRERSGLFTGKVGAKLRLDAHQPSLPGPGERTLYASTMVRDPDTGRLVIVGTRDRSSAEPAYTVDVSVSYQEADGTWAPFTEVGGPISDAYQDDIDAVARHGRATAVLSSRMVDTASVLGRPLIFEGAETGGTWAPPTSAPFTTATDGNAQVAIRPDGALVLTYVSCRGPLAMEGPGRIAAAVREASGWSAPAWLSKRSAVRLDSVTTDKHGNPVVGFARRPSDHRADPSCT